MGSRKLRVSGIPSGAGDLQVLGDGLRDLRVETWAVEAAPGGDEAPATVRLLLDGDSVAGQRHALAAPISPRDRGPLRLLGRGRDADSGALGRQLHDRGDLGPLLAGRLAGGARYRRNRNNGNSENRDEHDQAHQLTLSAESP